VIRAVRHIGLVVRDLERSVAFYTEVFGLLIHARAKETGPYIEQLTGLSDVILEWAKLELPGGALLELLQYHSHPVTEAVSPFSANCLGCSHPAFTVDDLRATLKRLEKAGGFAAEPAQSPEGAVLVAYARDPDGIILELVQELGEKSLAPEDIDLVVYDFDGVMTDNRVHTREDGLESVSANRGDGLGVNMIKALGLPQIILSTERNPVVLSRAKKIGIPAIGGCSNKLTALIGYAETNGYAMERILFVGNDINDLDAMLATGYPVAPADADESVRRICVLVTKAPGGAGVVRELAGVLTRNAGR